MHEGRKTNGRPLRMGLKRRDDANARKNRRRPASASITSPSPSSSPSQSSRSVPLRSPSRRYVRLGNSLFGTSVNTMGELTWKVLQVSTSFFGSSCALLCKHIGLFTSAGTAVTP